MLAYFLMVKIFFGHNGGVLEPLEPLPGYATADKRCHAKLFVDGHLVKFLLDTGSTANVIPVTVLKSLQKRISDLKPPRSRLSMFDHTQLRTLGVLSAKLIHPRMALELDVEFYVAETETAVLGVDACRRLDLIRIVVGNLCEAHESSSDKSRSQPSDRPVPAPRRRSVVPTSGRITEADIVELYPDVFDGRLGLLEGDVHLEADPNVPPAQMPLRRQPVAVRDRVEAELQKLVAENVIAPVTKPTPSSEMHIADTLSRAYPSVSTQSTAFPEELAVLSTVDADQLSELKMIASAGTIDIINKSVSDDYKYTGLIDQVVRGWPDNSRDVATYLRPFYTFADELSVSNGLVFKGQCLIVPRTARAYILDRLHTAHTGVNACLRRAREILAKHYS
jgi:hypothetical protein